MKFTKDWLDIHLKSKKKESQIIDKLNNIGCLLYTSDAADDC